MLQSLINIFLSYGFWIALITIATPLLIAASGELVVEKSGVLNLGMEGMMLIGAVVAFAVTYATGGNYLFGILAAMLAAALSSLLFGYLTITLAANQVATGLALTIFGLSFSALVGEDFVGKTVKSVQPLFDIAIDKQASGGEQFMTGMMQLFFGHTLYVYFAFALLAAVHFFLFHTRQGLILRAVGESDSSAHSIGYSVAGVRFAAVCFGGAMAGIAGSFFSLVLTPMWAEEMTGGRGWIALALVVFSSWKPVRLLIGALLFGFVLALELYVKAAGITLFAPEFLAALPYLATIAVLALISILQTKGSSVAPACLGKPFQAGAH